MSGDRDEKRMVGLNELNLGAKLAKQVAKRTGTSRPDEETLSQHLVVAAAPVPAAELNTLATTPAHATDNCAYFDKWDEYYPRLVGWLGWATWGPFKYIVPGSALLMFKSILAVANNDLMPIARQWFGCPK
jgi:hypothetical protein